MIESPVTVPPPTMISVADIRTHLNIVDDEEADGTLTNLLNEAVARAEEITRRALYTQTWDFFYSAFCTPLRLGRGVCQSVTEIEYIDSNGAGQILPTTEYRVSKANNVVATITPAIGKSWPTSVCPPFPEAVRVRAEVGYPQLPWALRRAILFLIGHYYENREEAVTGTIVASVPDAARSILLSHQVPGLV